MKTQIFNCFHLLLWSMNNSAHNENWPPGGTLILSPYVGSNPASTIHPKKYQEFQAPQKNIWNFSNPKNYPPFCTLNFRRDPKKYRNDPLIL